MLGELTDFARRKGEKDTVTFPWINQNEDKLRSKEGETALITPSGSFISLGPLALVS